MSLYNLVSGSDIFLKEAFLMNLREFEIMQN